MNRFVLAASLMGSLLGAAHAASIDLSTNGNTPVAPAACGPGSRPEPGLQGQVPKEDRDSGRSRQGYSCNLRLVGQYQGEGSGVVSDYNGRCAYLSTSGLAPRKKALQGVQVLDVRDPAAPVRVKSLASRAFKAGTWESLKISPDGKLLAGVGAPVLIDGGKFDVYDISGDCTQPRLLNKSWLTGDSLPSLNLAHEGGWSPDSKTYWSTAAVVGTLSAIDVSDPARPKTIYFGGSNLITNHGFSFSADGRRMYLSSAVPAGIKILDVSDIQDRKPGLRLVRTIGSITWLDGGFTQMSLPVSVGGRPYLIVVDESGGIGSIRGAVRFIDIADERAPKIVSHLRLDIQLMDRRAVALADNGDNGPFGYDAHYCSVDRPVNPTALACGYTQSGIRVFDIRDMLKPREIAYFNPRAQTGRNAERRAPTTRRHRCPRRWWAAASSIRRSCCWAWAGCPR